MLNKYLLYLYYQYCKATGISVKLEDLKELNYEFLEWVARNKLISKEYLQYLVYLGVLSEKSVLEIGKGRYDTISGENIEIVSPFASSLGKEDSDLLIIDSMPLIAERKRIIVPNVDILLTHNPYFPEILVNWDRIHNSGQYDISIGMYGSIHDKDWQEKIEVLEILSEKLDDDYRIDYDTDDDKFFCVLNSDRKIKRKVKTLYKGRFL